MAKKKGALSKSPSNAAKTQGKPSADPKKEYRSLQGRNDPQSRQRRRALMKEIQAQRRAGQQQQQQSPYEMPQQGIGQGMNMFLQQMQQQGAFQPGSFQDQMNKAYGDVMQQFEMTTGPQFQREQADFAQMAAERGLDPNSEAYRSLQGQLSQRQDLARQQAMNQASMAAQAVQAQGFGQAAQQYQMPGQMLGQFAPFYGQMGEDVRQQNLLGFQGEQGALDRATQLQLANIQARAARGGGGLSFEQQRQLQQEGIAGNIAGQLALQGGQQQGGGGGGGFGQGLAQGIGSSLPYIVGGIMGGGRS